MFDIGSPELLLIAIVAIVVIGPKDLPKAMRIVGYWVGKARGTMRQFRSGFDAMVREAELAEMEKRWAAENERIMRDHPPSEPEKALPAPGDAVGEYEPRADPAGDDAPPVMVEKPDVAVEPELPLADTPASDAKRPA